MNERELDEAAIRELVADADTFQSDVEQFTALLTENVVIVNIVGIRVAGRDEFRQVMGRALETPLANVRTRTELEEITFLGPDAALASCIKHVFDDNADASSATSRGRLTFVVVNRDGAWRIALAQTTPMLV